MTKKITKSYLTLRQKDLPPGIKFNHATRTFSGKPTQVGRWRIPYTIKTNFGKDSGNIYIIVRNPGEGDWTRYPIVPKASHRMIGDGTLLSVPNKGYILVHVQAKGGGKSFLKLTLEKNPPTSTLGYAGIDNYYTDCTGTVVLPCKSWDNTLILGTRRSNRKELYKIPGDWYNSPASISTFTFSVGEKGETINGAAITDSGKWIYVTDSGRVYRSKKDMFAKSVSYATDKDFNARIGFRINPEGVANYNGVVCAASNDGRVAICDDEGDNWRIYNAPDILIKPKNVNGDLLAWGKNTKCIYRSTDGINWYPTANPPIPFKTVKSVDYAYAWGSIYIGAIGETNSGEHNVAYFSKLDLGTWAPTLITEQKLKFTNIVFKDNTSKKVNTYSGEIISEVYACTASMGDPDNIYIIEYTKIDAMLG